MLKIFLFLLLIISFYYKQQPFTYLKFKSMNASIYQTNEPQSLKAGDQAPLFESKANNGETINLSTLLKKGPVVLFFYRGAWCPYCNKHISELQDSIHLIKEKGASVIGISPEIETSIIKTIEKTHATFPLIHDEEYKIMNAYKVAFKVDEKTIEQYKKWSIDIESANGNTDFILPVPATYVIGKDGIIKFVHFNPDYKQRAKVKEILEHL